MNTKTLSVLLVMAACGVDDDKGAPLGDSGGADGLTGPFCEDVITPLGWDEAAPDGTVPSEAIASLEGSFASTFSHADDTTTPITIDVARTGEPSWVESEVVTTSSGVDIAIECPNHVSIPVAVTLRTDDGVLDEAWTQAHRIIGLTGSSADPILISLIVDPSELGGSWTASDIDTDDYDFVEVHLQGTVAEGQTSGDVSLMGQQTLGESVSFGPVASIGSWGAETE